MKQKLWAIIAFLYCFMLGITAQQNNQKQIVVSGVVTDANNEPLIGANVTVKNVPGLGAITNIDGKYTIKMQPYNRLVFSYIGYETQEILVKEEHTVNVVMKENKETALDEVVITATGAQKKLTVTGAVTTVNVDRLKASPSGSISNSLAGNVAGVIARQTTGQPGKNVSEFWIRGISTFGAGAGALVLVDGFERDMNELNYEDIESFTVLKDASETAIYGSRGANGVVLITTRRGKVDKITIDAKVETMYNTRTFTPDFVDGITYAYMANEARRTRNLDPIYTGNELKILKQGLDPDLLPNVDWMDELLKKGAMSYRASLNLSGGGENARYFVSASYLDEGGMYKVDKSLKDYNTNSNAKRWNYRMNADINITKTTLLQVGIGGALKKMNESGLTSDQIWTSLLFQTPTSMPKMYSNGYVPTDADGNLNPWVASTQCGYNEQWWNNIQTNVTLNQKLDFITKGLNFVGRFGFDTDNYNYIRRFKCPELWSADRYRKDDGSINFTRQKKEQVMDQTSGNSGERKEYFEAELQYARNFKGHMLNGTLKYSQDAKVRTQEIGKEIVNSLPFRHQGLAGRIAYNWNYRYFLNFNFGYTGSENFASGHQFGFFPAYSTAWNIAEEPFVKKNLKWMNMFKVRYSWGKVGNDKMYEPNGVQIRFPYLYTIGYGGAPANIWGDNNGYYSAFGGYNWADYGYGSLGTTLFQGLRYTSYANPGVTWEIATKHDVGLDMSIFDDKFMLTVDYFQEKRKGIFMYRNFLPATAGIEGGMTNPRANVGAVFSKGVDGNMTYKQQIGKVLLTARANATLSKNEVKEKDEQENIYPYRMERGYRVNQAKGLIALGLFKDYDDIRNSPKQTFGNYMPGDIKYKDVNGDGIIDDQDQVAVGATTVPNLVYGIGVSAQWKGLDVNVHFQGAGKSSFFIDGEGVRPFASGNRGNFYQEVIDGRWISKEESGTIATENPHAKYPRLSYGYNDNNNRNSSYWLRNGSYLRLKTLEVGYTLPKKIVNRIHFNNIRIYMIGTNLITWSKFKMWDPEMNSSNGATYPLAKSVTVGLNVNL